MDVARNGVRVDGDALVSFHATVIQRCFSYSKLLMSLTIVVWHAESRRVIYPASQQLPWLHSRRRDKASEGFCELYVHVTPSVTATYPPRYVL